MRFTELATTGQDELMEWTRVVVVIPAHNEVVNLPRSLRAVALAARRASVPVQIVVVLDSCGDGSASLAGRFGANVHFVQVEARNVGASRHAGFAYARTLSDEGGLDETGVWYANTDADSRVEPDWLTRQLSADADVVLGVVRIANWRDVPAHAIRRYLHAYRTKRHGRAHGHVHGANMGCAAEVYWRIGGFAALTTGEDVDLVHRLEEAGCRIVRDDRLSVVTSARRVGRAPGGFAGHLRGLVPGGQRDSA